MDILRSHFANQPAAKALGLKRSAFSYIHKDGACPGCKGLGEVRIPMDFFGDLWSPCEACQGLRYRPEVLACRVNGHSMGDVLQWSVTAAASHFAELPKLRGILALLQEVGLGHLRLGQECNTLSGGEAQRLRLAKTLLQKGQGRRLFLLDEPSTGLHFEDVSRLLKLFRRLTDAGHTLVYIEHHPLLIALADRKVELGPGAGAEGGRLLG
jgi:excinuclease ABC subunit A